MAPSPRTLGSRRSLNELGHADGISYRDYGRDEAEVIVKNRCGDRLLGSGLDIQPRAISYIASYANGDPSKLEKFAKVIDATARKLEKAMGVGCARDSTSSPAAQRSISPSAR